MTTCRKKSKKLVIERKKTLNKLLKTIVFDGQITLSVLDTTEMVNDAIKIHKLSPVCAAALGRTLTVCTFMSSNLKNQKDKLSVTIKGDGKGGKITVCGNGNLEMRGFIDNPQIDLPLRSDGKLNVGACVGKNGRLTVVRSMGLKEPYTGSSELISGEIAEDFTAYYAFSEQMPTAMALGVKIGTDGKCVGAGGVIVQALPGATDEALFLAEEIVKDCANVSTLIENHGAEWIVKELFFTDKYNEYNPEYKCLCTRGQIEKVLISLGKDELLDIVKSQGKISVECEFCDKIYEFNEIDVENFFK